jgi:radical SAM superfamily enzyme YgiQ (UPF0313 family)
MDRYLIDDLEIIFDVRGRDDWAKFSFPVYYGMFVRVRWEGYEFDFSLRGHLKRISGNASVWPSPLEQIKRTDANDLIYYGVYGYEDTYDLIKNYYVPYNAIYDLPVFSEKPLESPYVKKALVAFDRLTERAKEIVPMMENGRLRSFLAKVATHDREVLALEGERLHGIMGGTLPVLPPDTTNVDYEVIPVMVMDGCTQNCGFCQFKTDKKCKIRTGENIAGQISGLKELLGEDLINYNSVVLGENNALAAGAEVLEFTAEEAHEILSLGKSYYKGDSNLFLFGSVDFFLEAKERSFESLNGLPYNTCLNIGLESPDDDTLNLIGKSLTAEAVREAFRKALYINDTYDRINITSNFILGKDLPQRHLEELKNLLAEVDRRQEKGTIYLSPLIGASDRRQILREFKEIKRASRLPVYLYLMQRL